jgi:hypothetical protein
VTGAPIITELAGKNVLRNGRKISKKPLIAHLYAEKTVHVLALKRMGKYS